MFTELIDLAASLDEHIEKGEKLELKKASQKKADLRKALTFDPYNPTTYNEDSGIYNPYRMVDGGGYLPYPVEYWRSQGKDAQHLENGQPSGDYIDSYDSVKRLYDKFKPVEQASQNLRAFRRSLEMDLFKAGAVPIGTVHTYSDGQRYVKQGEGQWKPVAANDGNVRKYLDHPNKEWSKQVNGMISQHAEKIARIKDAIERKSKIEKDTPDLKGALDTLKTHFSKFYEGGKIPDDVHEFFEKVSKNPDGLSSSAKPESKEANKDSKKQVSDAPKKHHVGVEFSHNGQNYNHNFENIQANSHGEAVAQIMKIMDKRLPGHKLSKIHATSSDNKEVKNENTK